MGYQITTPLALKIMDGKVIQLVRRQNAAMRGVIAKPYYTIDEQLIENPIHGSSSTYKTAKLARAEYARRTR